MDPNMSVSFGQEIDLDFLFEEGYENEKADACTFNVDDIFESESKNPVFGSDLSLASALNFNSDDEFLACASTDEHSPLYGKRVKQVEPVLGKEQSPLHESDSGMSDTSPSASPNRLDQEDATVVIIDPTPTSQQTPANNMDVLNVNIEDLDFDIDQWSPSSSSTASPPHIQIYQDEQLNAANSTVVDDFITEADVQQKKALEFFDSYSNQPKTLKLVKVQPVDVPENKSRKNAIQAKINREKKKAYIKSLEDETTSLKSDNAKLKFENQRMQSNISELEEEVEYLKSVLVNSSALSGLLKNISNVPDVKLSATVIGRKRSVADDHSYNFESAPTKRARRINENLKKAGVCLHVNDGSASLEFCAHCSKLAHKTSLS